MDLSQLYMLEMMRKRRLADTFPAYRTSDLVLMLDGIKNQRSGGHNSSATIWEDLASNMDFTLFNSTWGSNYVSFTGNLDSFGLGNFLTLTKGFTIEVVFRLVGSEPFRIAGCMINSALVYRPAFWVNDGVAYACTYGTRYASPQPAISSGFFGHGAASKLAIGINGNFSANTQTDWRTGTSQTQFRLGVWRNTSDTANETGFNGNIYAVRVYDANLTAEELYAHWLIDKKRFNRPD